MLNKIRKKLFGKQYAEMEKKYKYLEKVYGVVIDLLHEVKAERDELKMELAEAYTYMAELKAKVEGKGD